MRVIFMGTPPFAVPSLRALVDHGHDVVAVVTQPDRRVGRGQSVSPPAVKQEATRAGFLVLQPPTLRDLEIVAALRSLSPDLIVVVAYGQILRRAVLDLPPLGCINLHPSLLPRWRGASPIQATIRAGDDSTGVTIIQMDQRMDAGPILSQVTATVKPDDTAMTLGDRLARLGAETLIDTVRQIAAGAIVQRPQIDELATYCQPLKKEDADVDWTQTSDEIAHRCRAQTPWPGCQSYWKGKHVRLAGLRSWPDWRSEAAPGLVVSLTTSDVANPIVGVATGLGAVEVGRLQLAGKRALAPSDFLRGQPTFLGSRLGGRRSD